MKRKMGEKKGRKRERSRRREGRGGVIDSDPRPRALRIGLFWGMNGGCGDCRGTCCVRAGEMKLNVILEICIGLEAHL